MIYTCSHYYNHLKCRLVVKYTTGTWCGCYVNFGWPCGKLCNCTDKHSSNVYSTCTTAVQYIYNRQFGNLGDSAIANSHCTVANGDFGDGVGTTEDKCMNHKPIIKPKDLNQQRKIFSIIQNIFKQTSNSCTMGF